MGLITQRLGLSPIVGYLLGGILIGPYTPGYKGDLSLAPQLAELGVILLMFGVGLHFHLKDLLAVKFIAVPGALGQTFVATLAGGLVFSWFGWPWSAGLVLGMAMAVASTVVLMRVLMDSDQLNSPQGHAAVGWLIVEDIITVVVLVLIPTLASPLDPAAAQVGGHVVAESAGQGWLAALAWALLKLGVLVALMLYGGARVVPWVLVRVARLRSRELFTLTVLVLAIAIAAGSAAFFGASMALGAFLAGMVVAQSPVSQEAGADALPLRDAFAVLFFVAVGMLFDPWFLVERPWLVAAGLGIVLLAKPVAALVIVAVLGYPARTAMTVAVGLAQIGEFSFILGDLAFYHGLIPEEGKHLLVACALGSITLNPLLFRLIEPLERRLQGSPSLWKLLNGRSMRRATEVTRQTADALHAAQAASDDDRPLAIIVGYGPVGRQVDRLLRQAGVRTVIIDLNVGVITSLSAEGRMAIYGDATRQELLEQAGIKQARYVVVTVPHASNRLALISIAKRLNPTVRLFIRTRYLREAAEVIQYGAHVTAVDEVESAVALVQLMMAETGADPDLIRVEAMRVRDEISATHRPSHA